MGHSICIRAFVHVGHTRSLWVHVAHYHMMCAYVTRRGTIGYYIRCIYIRCIYIYIYIYILYIYISYQSQLYMLHVYLHVCRTCNWNGELSLQRANDKEPISASTI